MTQTDLCTILTATEQPNEQSVSSVAIPSGNTCGMLCLVQQTNTPM
jgi:DNA gyrase inhibitor GyrI